MLESYYNVLLLISFRKHKKLNGVTLFWLKDDLYNPLSNSIFKNEGNALKTKLLNGILIIYILTILLIPAILFIPDNPARIIIGLPFVLFFPGYVLLAVLFPHNEKMNWTERAILSFGLSIAITALIGIGLNYTPWGIRLESVLYSSSIFIFILSTVALFRRPKLPEMEDNVQGVPLRLPGYRGNVFNKLLTITLAIAILGTIGTIGYTSISPKTGERFSEFYILGIKSKAEDYPDEFIMQNNQVISVKYGEASSSTDKIGKVTLGIVNHEQKKMIYSVMIKVDDQEVNIFYAGQVLSQLNGIELAQGDKWEGEIGFAPLHTGDNQKVEFLLFKDKESVPENSIYFYINVKEE